MAGSIWTSGGVSPAVSSALGMSTPSSWPEPLPARLATNDGDWVLQLSALLRVLGDSYRFKPNPYQDDNDKPSSWRRFGETSRRVQGFARASWPSAPEAKLESALADLARVGHVHGIIHVPELAFRLADEVANDPRRAAEDWIVREILPKSAAALRHAVRAARLRWNAAFLQDLAEAERIYLEDLMKTEDAVEGIEAFLEKRPAAWKDR